jgi:hypothetical protein
MPVCSWCRKAARPPVTSGPSGAWRQLPAALALAGVLSADGCRSSTEYGKCVGVSDERDPALTYEVSPRNVILGVVFFGTIFAPLLVVLTEWTCPVGRKAVAK